MGKSTSLLVAALAVACLAFAAHQAAPAAWPEPGQPGYGPVQLQVHQNDVTLSATVSQVVADRDGYLVRIVTLSQVGDGRSEDRILSVGTANPSVNTSWPFGAGSGTWHATVQPREGLTWGLVNTASDLVITSTKK